MKLSPAQRSLLIETNVLHGTACVPHYAPAKKLVELGLAQWSVIGISAERLCITDAGRLALRKEAE